jgi:hypothetical protein
MPVKHLQSDVDFVAECLASMSIMHALLELPYSQKTACGNVVYKRWPVKCVLDKPVCETCLRILSGGTNNARG